MREIAAGAQHQIQRSPYIGLAEFLGHHVVPGRAGPREHGRAALQSSIACEPLKPENGAPQPDANGILFLEHALVHLDAGKPPPPPSPCHRAPPRLHLPTRPPPPSPPPRPHHH